MKHLFSITAVLILSLSNVVFAQTSKNNVTSKTEKIASVTKKENKKVDFKKLKKFVGKYNLEEANITLEIVQEKNKMYIVSPWGKDPLDIKNENTLFEPSRGVYLKTIKDNPKN